MNNRFYGSISRVFRAVVVSSAILSAGASTGCSMVKAAANPGLIWAATEPAPMPVVVRRVHVAELTANEVERLLSATPVDDESAWLAKVNLTAEEGKTLLEAAQKRAAYEGTPAKVMAVEAWLKTLKSVKSEEKAHANLLAFINKDLGDSFNAVLEKKKELAQLEGEKKKAEDAADDDKASEADKKANEEKAKALEEKIAKAEEEVDPLVEKFLASVKENSAKASEDVRNKVGPAIVNLQQAVASAKLAASAGLLRYPLALPAFKDDLMKYVPGAVADVVEDQTGKRPSLKGLQPGIELDGTDVKVTINGLNQDDLGKLSVGDVVSETVSRTTELVGKSFALVPNAASTQSLLSFEEDVLTGIQEGFESAGWKAPAAVKIEDLAGAPVAKK